MTLPLIAAPLGAILAKSSGITLDPIAKPIAAVLAFFYSLIPNFGIAIVLLTVCVMIVLTPLTIKQTRSMLVMQKLQPELKRLQEQHKNDRQALNEAVMALYKEHNASPLGGCLPMLLPLPVFLALFRILERLSRVVTDPLTGKPVSSPKYLSHNTRMYQDIVHAGGHLNAFGMDLAKSAANVGGTFWDKLPYFILLLVMVGTQYYQQRQLTSRNPQAAQGQQQQIMKFIPLFFGLISIRFPAGVVLYWTTSNGIRIFQQWAMYRWDPKVKALVVQDVKEVEAKTREIDEQERKSPPTRPRLRDLLSGAAGNAAAQGGNKPSSSGKPSSSSKPPASGKPPSRARPSSGTRTGQGSGRGTTGKPTRSSTPRPAPAKPIAKGNLNGRADEGADAVPPKPTRQGNADEGADAGPPKPGPSNAGPPDAGAPDTGSPSAVPPKPTTGRTPNGSGGSRTGAGSARSRSKRARRGR